MDLPNKAGLWKILRNFGIRWVFKCIDCLNCVLAILHDNRQLIRRNLLPFIWAGLAGDLMAKRQPEHLKTNMETLFFKEENEIKFLQLCFWCVCWASVCIQMEHSVKGCAKIWPETHTSHGSLSTVMLMSSLLAESRSRPVIVMTVPPAAGPLDGNTASGTGSFTMRRKTNLSVNMRLLTAPFKLKSVKLHSILIRLFTQTLFGRKV